MPGVPMIPSGAAATIQRNAEKPYSFSSTPRTILARKFKYRNEALGRKGVTNEPGPGGWRHEECRGESQKEMLSYGNIMYDRRVIRGSTVAQHPFSVPGPESNAARIAEARRRTMARKKAQGQATRAMRLRLGTPPPVEGRKHEDVQTEVFLEELFDHPKEETVAVQTEPFLDRPETPPYIPAKTGVDVSTQIEPGELFDFNVEVQPILEVLVGKTIEQALIEVLEEDELAAIKEQQRRYREIRAAEKAEEERLEEEERRRREEKDRRVAEQMDACRIQKETEERVAAAVLTTGYIADLLPSVLDGLKLAGYLVDDIKEDLEENYMPWLMEEVKLEMQRMVENKDLLSEIVREILETRAALYVNEGKSEDYDKHPLPDPYTLHHEGEEEEVEEEQNPVSKINEDEAERNQNHEMKKAVAVVYEKEKLES